MGNFCGLCSCIYPRFDDDNDEFNYQAFNEIEKQRRQSAGTDNFENYQNQLEKLNIKQAMHRRLSTSMIYNTLSAQSNRRRYSSLNPIYTITTRSSPLIAVQLHQQSPIMSFNLKQCLSTARSSSIVSLNDHTLFMEVADLHMAELKRQFAASDSSVAETDSQVQQEEEYDSGFDVTSVHSSSTSKSSTLNNHQLINTNSSNFQATFRQQSSTIKSLTYYDIDDINYCNNTKTAEQIAVTNATNASTSDIKKNNNMKSFSSSPLVYFFKTMHSLTNMLIKNSHYSTPLLIGNNYLFKITKNSLNRIKHVAESIKLKSSNHNNNKTSTAKKFVKKTKQPARRGLNVSRRSIDVSVIEPVTSACLLALPSTSSSSSEFYDSFSASSLLAPFTQFLLRINDVNFF